MDGCEIVVRLQPRARANEVVGERDGALLVRVTAAPVDGRANEALCRLIAKRARAGVRRSCAWRESTSGAYARRSHLHPRSENKTQSYATLTRVSATNDASG